MKTPVKISVAAAVAVAVIVAVVGLRQGGDEEDRSNQLTPLQAQALLPPDDTFTPVFRPCAHCHQIGKGARNSTGPVLTGIIGRPAASTDYPYSKAMRESGLIWDETTLRAFLNDPKGMVPGTRMIFHGLPQDKLDQLIDFLKSEARAN